MKKPIYRSIERIHAMYPKCHSSVNQHSNAGRFAQSWFLITLLLCHPLLLLSSVFPSIRVFLNEWVVCIRWPKYWSFSFSNSPPNKYSGLISFRIDWLDLLALQGTLKTLLQHCNSKAPILPCPVFFMVQISHLYVTTGKTKAFDYMDLCWQSNVSALLRCNLCNNVDSFQIILFII